MTRDDSLPEMLPPTSGQDAYGTIVIPCSPNDFGQFISGLLRVPKELRYARATPFILRFDDIRDFDRLIEQRISDQSRYSKASANFSAYYSDGTSVHCGEIEEFSSHANLNGSLCNRISMEWVYLIEFPQNKNPQKQQIRVEFYTSYGPKSYKKDEIDIHDLTSTSFFGEALAEFSVHHTNATFGYDMANLLKERIRRLSTPSKLQRIVRRSWFKVPWFLLFGVSGAGLSLSISSSVNNFLTFNAENVVEILLSGGLVSALAIATSLSVILVITFIALGSFLHDTIEKAKPSFIILNLEHQDSYKSADAKRVRNGRIAWVLALASYIGGVSQGIISSGLWEMISSMK
jgi:hypothetical protein